MDELDPHPSEPHDGSHASRLNWLRAGVLGANDGIVSIAGLVVGVAGATTDSRPVLLAGVAGLAAGALSMAGGEYVSVSTQRDSEQALLAKERRELAEMPHLELQELTEMYAAKGLTEDVAAEVARQLTAHDALAAHAEIELGIDPHDLTSPWDAAFASMIAFAIAGTLPLLAITLPSVSLRVPITVAAVVVALTLTGWVSARLGKSRPLPAIVRNVGVGVVAMGLTFAVGLVVGPGA